MAYQPDNVTNAVLSSKLDALSREVRALGSNMGKRIDFLEEKLELNVGAVREECRENTTQIARLDERQKATTGVLGVVQAATIAAATWLGLS